jgi:hypothetical protein
MKSFTTVGFLMLIAFVSCTRKQLLTEEEVINVIKRFDQGWRNKNLKAVDSVLAPAYIYFTQSGGTFSRDSVVQTAGSPSYTLERMDRREFVVQLYGNTAVVSTRWQGKGSYKGTAFNEDQRCSITIIKRNNKVEILTEHCTPIKGNRIFH